MGRLNPPQNRPGWKLFEIGRIKMPKMFWQTDSRDCRDSRICTIPGCFPCKTEPAVLKPTNHKKNRKWMCCNFIGFLLTAHFDKEAALDRQTVKQKLLKMNQEAEKEWKWMKASIWLVTDNIWKISRLAVNSYTGIVYSTFRHFFFLPCLPN